MSTSAASPIPNSRWYRVGILLFLIYLVCFADRSNIGVAAPSMVAELQLSGTVTGLLLSAFFWGYVITQLPGGWMANRVGAKRVIVGALIIVGITGCLTGLVHDIQHLMAVRFVMGLAEGVVWPSFAVMFVNWFPGSERGRAVSLAQYALPVSSVIMAPLAGWMIREFSWQHMFVMQGIPAFVLAAVFALVASEDPATDKRISKAERDHIVAGRSVATVETGKFADVLRNPLIWGFCATYFLWITGMYAFSMWVPTVIKQLANSGIETVGWLTALPYVFATLGMYLVARMADRSSISRGWYVVGALSLAGVSLLVQHSVASSVTWSMVMLVLTGVGIYSAMGAWWSWALANVPRNQAGPSIGLINLFGNFGGICGPLLVGMAARGGAASEGFYMVGVALLIGACLALVLAIKVPRPLQATSAEPHLTH